VTPPSGGHTSTAQADVDAGQAAPHTADRKAWFAKNLKRAKPPRAKARGGFVVLLPMHEG